MSNRGGKSDRCVVPQKLSNKAAGEIPAAVASSQAVISRFIVVSGAPVKTGEVL